jgi:hypothetical protein
LVLWVYFRSLRQSPLAGLTERLAESVTVVGSWDGSPVNTTGRRMPATSQVLG